MRSLYVPIAAALVFLGFALSLMAVRSCDAHKGDHAQQQAQQHTQESHQHEGAGQAYTDELKAIYAKLAEAEAATKRARAEVARLKALPPQVITAEVPAIPEVQPLDTAKDALIGALEHENSELKVALQKAVLRGDEYEKALSAERKARLAQDVALEAWKRGTKADRWIGRIEGFAVGAALGYVGGRR